MNHNNMFLERKPLCFHHFGNKGFSLFSVLGKEVIISVLSVATLTFASVDSISAKTLPTMTEAPDEEFEELADSTAGPAQALSELEVVGTRIPMPVDKAVRLVQVLSHEDIEHSSAHTVNDILKLVAGVDVRQRGAFGVQTDVGVNGGTQDQVTILLNGVNISSAHTGHLAMDLPVSINDIERIEVLEGGASRVYGSSAFSGAINIVTKGADKNSLDLNLQGGSYGSAGADGGIGIFTPLNGEFNGTVGQRISGSYARSDGGVANTDFNKSQGFYYGKWNSSVVDMQWQAGMSNMNYGASTFYSPKYDNQYEENHRYMASVSADIMVQGSRFEVQGSGSKVQGSRSKAESSSGIIHIMPRVSWNQSQDHYILMRNKPAAYQNFHKLNTYSAQLNLWTEWMLGKTSVGVEMRRENILSTTLGKALDEYEWVQVSGYDAYYKYKDGRTNWDIYFEHDIILNKVSISLGVLANKNTALNYPMHLYPGVDVSWSPVDGLRLYASFNQSLRMPTYTDFYYNGPSFEGNPDIKPEKSTDYSLGAQWYGGGWNAQLKGFYRRGTNMIDWVKYTADDNNHASNIDLDYYGIDAVIGYNPLNHSNFLNHLTLSYSYVYQEKQSVPENIFSSAYALDYLKNKLVVSLSHRIISKLEAQWDFILKHRNGGFDLYDSTTKTYSEHPYGTQTTLDLKLQWQEPHYSLYLQANNLTDNQYYDITNVLQPGFWLMAGIKMNIGL